MNAVTMVTSGNTPVIRKTPWAPYVSTRLPLKYAEAMPPTAADSQHRDCREPAVSWEAPRVRSTTMESITTSLQAVPTAPRTRRANTPDAVSTPSVPSAPQASAPVSPDRARYDRRLYPNSGTASLRNPYTGLIIHGMKLADMRNETSAGPSLSSSLRKNERAIRDSPRMPCTK